MDIGILREKYINKFKSLSKKQKTYLGALIILVIALFWAFVSAAVITSNFNRNQIQTDKDRQEALIEGVILTETKDNQKYWEIYGENGNYDSKNGVAMLDNVIGNFYGDDKNVSMSFQSSKGSYNEIKKQIILYENTYIVLKDFTTLRANKLEWSGRDIPVIAKGNVIITKDNDFLATADEVIISPDFETFKIVGKTTTKIFNDKEIK